MRKILIAGILLAFSCSVFAAVEIHDHFTGSDGTKYYLVTSDTSPQLKGSELQFWMIADFKAPKYLDKVGPFRSAQTRASVDCKGKRHRTLSASLYSETMLHGELVFTSKSPSDWDPVLPNSAFSFALLVCEAKGL